MRTPISVAVIGLGRLGLELARTFDELPQSALRRIWDPRPEVQLRSPTSNFTSALASHSVDEILDDETVDAVVLATPVEGRAEFLRHALKAGKHVLVRGPLALDSEEADRLVELARAVERRLCVENVGLFAPELRKLKALVEAGRLGELFYATAVHTDTADLTRDESVVWTLGLQPVSLLLFLLDDEPVEVVVCGDAFVRRRADVAFCHLRFATGIVAHLQLSRLDRRTDRRIVVVGSNRMAVYDELDADRPLTVDHTRLAVSAEGAAAVRVGDLVSPRAPRERPMRLQCEHFLAAIRSPSDATPARRDAAVVHTLEALERSLDQSGAVVPVGGPAPQGASVVRLATRRH